MTFKELQQKIVEKFNEIQKADKLFRVEVQGDYLWLLYLNSFKPGDDPVFRDPESTSHTGNLDKNFIRRYGNVVGLDENYNIVTMFDITIPEDSIYYTPMKSLSSEIKKSSVKDIFIEDYEVLNQKLNYERTHKSFKTFKLGIPENHKIYTQEEADKYGVVTPGRVYKFNHFYVDLDRKHVNFSSSSVETLSSVYRSNREVLHRGLQEIELPTLHTVIDLIDRKSLLDGTTHLQKVKGFLQVKEEYLTLKSKLTGEPLRTRSIKLHNWTWKIVNTLSSPKFRNELIGVLCTEIQEDLVKAVKNWNIRVDPVNYMKATAPITQNQINEAEKFVEENGYTESFDRRFATIEDISIEEIVHVSNKEKKQAGLFSDVKPGVTKGQKIEKEKLQEISIEKFMSEVLPSSKFMEVLFENKHIPNLVTLTNSSKSDTKRMFKWSNNLSYTFKGGLAGKSQLKQEVEKLGGKIDGVLRFSISWNKTGNEIVDLDAHAFEPGGREIYYGSHKGRGEKTPLSGYLDIDMIRPTKLGVENITWVEREKMKDGVYKLLVNNYDGGQSNGFEAEVEVDGQIYHYSYKKRLQLREKVVVAEVIKKKDTFTVNHLLPCETSSKKVWGLDTENFHPVELICLSPNHWGENNVGNKYFLFLLHNCKTDENTRSFHVENLNTELLDHRKVMEVLAETRKLLPSGEKQLSGIGFNSTVSEELVVKVDGRLLKIKF